MNSRDFLVPGTLVPRATNAMALTPSLRLMKQPRWPATSPMTAVQAPIMKIEITKVGYPLASAAKQGACISGQNLTKAGLKF